MTDPSSLPPSGSSLPDATMHLQDVAALQLHLPTFSRNNLLLWFAEVEATFDLHLNSSEISRFRHLLCNLSREVAQEVVDVITAPLSDAPYQCLKQRILDRTPTSESACLRHLLTSEELRDRRPSAQQHATAPMAKRRRLERRAVQRTLPAALAAAHSPSPGCFSISLPSSLIESTMRLLLRSPHSIQH
ncbi:hypothetical protein HPB50_015027 [Hyalomma asiaticum]|uniref:Uncharacterized protein n=1 Tax=Hyalomma asiaticum TaxID=266040 RepID=A0ACB7SNH5_HYAAI|nr:hypothetical protein HPB50_015027 [Hyalomma asiaticum]